MIESDFQIIAVGIKKKNFMEKYGKITDDPYELSLSFLLERAVMEIGKDSQNTLSIVIESRGRVEDEILQKRYNRLLDVGTANILSHKFKTYFEKMEFKKKRDNDCGLQIADLCAYPVARNIINPNDPYPAYGIVAQKFRRNSNGSHIGYGLKIFP